MFNKTLISKLNNRYDRGLQIFHLALYRFSKINITPNLSYCLEQNTNFRFEAKIIL